MQSGFTVLDAIVLAAYLAATMWLGLYLGGRQKDSRDYFVGGNALPWWAVCFSVVATETSALTFISIPALAYIGNLGFLQVAAGYLLGRIVVAAVLLPRYYDGKLVTAYALLEQRFGLATRRFTSITFMATRAFGDSVRVFATSIPLALILGPAFPEGWGTPVSILILGAATVIYTYHGGMRAVVWTDVVQMFVYLLGGVAAIVLLGQGVDGGWSAILARAGEAGKLQFIDPAFVFNKPHTLWAGLIGGAFLSMASHGADQLIVQRVLGARSLAESKRAMVVSGVTVIAQFALFLMIGIGLWAYYDGRAFTANDAIFPEFIVNVMPAGLTGLVVAALLAAAMSTVSGSLNALSAATTHDLWLPLQRVKPDEATTLRAGRKFTLVWAVILVGGALLYREQGTPVVVIALAIASFTYGALLGGFFLGILVQRAREFDAILGMSVAIAVMSVVVFAVQLVGWAPWTEPYLGFVVTREGDAIRSLIAWPWYVLIGTSITLIVGWLSSLVGRPHPSSPISHPSQQ